MIKKLINKYKKSLTYIAVSLCTATFETIIGLICINVFGLHEVVANTIGVCIGTTLHYFLITRKVFDKSVGVKTILIYILTFFIGLALQDTVVGVVSAILKNVIDANISYIVSKFCSLAVSFVIMYQVRKFLYSKFG